MSKKIKISFLVLVLLLLVIQVFPVNRRLHEWDPGDDFINTRKIQPELSLVIRNSCYDCHSYFTKYPWYANIAPVSWLIQGHVNEGRAHVNFSTWKQLPANERSQLLRKCAGEIGEGGMPLASYRLMHPEARLSREEKEALIAQFEIMADSTYTDHE
jgi:hypothetical protein